MKKTHAKKLLYRKHTIEKNTLIMKESCDRETDEAWTQELEPSRRKSSGKDTGKKCSGRLYEVTERLRKPVFEEEKV